jgi:hypothetical protein
LENFILGGVIVGSLILIGIGVWRERRPIQPTPGARRVFPRLAVWRRVTQHPAPVFGLIETGGWLLMIGFMGGLLRSPTDGWIAYIVWVWTIVPHEIGHVICTPLGWLPMMAGGSIWQVLVFVLAAVFAFWVRRQITIALWFWALSGLSLINLSVYMGDARARQLPLLLGASKDHHDWWNLLGRYDLLEYDHVLAVCTAGVGAALVVLAAVLGILTAWALPRARWGKTVRFEGSLRRVLVQSLSRNTEVGDNESL